MNYTYKTRTSNDNNEDEIELDENFLVTLEIYFNCYCTYIISTSIFCCKIFI